MASHPERHSATHCVLCNQKLTAVHESGNRVRKIEPEHVLLDE